MKQQDLTLKQKRMIEYIKEAIKKKIRFNKTPAVATSEIAVMCGINFHIAFKNLKQIEKYGFIKSHETEYGFILWEINDK